MTTSTETILTQSERAELESLRTAADESIRHLECMPRVIGDEVTSLAVNETLRVLRAARKRSLSRVA